MLGTCTPASPVRLYSHADPCYDSQQLGTGSPSVWPALGKMWSDTANAVEKEDEDNGEAALVTSLAKLTRNLVAGIAQNQEQALCVGSSVP